MAIFDSGQHVTNIKLESAKPKGAVSLSKDRRYLLSIFIATISCK